MSEMIKEFKKGDLLHIDNDGKAAWGYPDGYPYKETTIVIEFLPEIELDFYEDEGVFPTDPDLVIQVPDFGIEMEKQYRLRIMWDGVPYDRTVLAPGKYIYFVGNQALSGEGADTGEPFFIAMTRVAGSDATYELDFLFIGASAGKHTVSIAEISETIHTMAPESLPYATTTTPGIVKQMPYLPNATGDVPTAENFNQLLRELKNAGLMK